jgi:hypothetical protein
VVGIVPSKAEARILTSVLPLRVEDEEEEEEVFDDNDDDLFDRMD